MEAALLALIRACVHVCMFTYCAYMHAHMHMCTCGGQGLTLDVLFSLSSLYFLTEGLSLSRKLTASARLAEQQPLGILLHLLSAGIIVRSCMGVGNPNSNVHLLSLIPSPA